MIRGEIIQPLALPVLEGVEGLFPSQFYQGSTNHTVESHGTLTLNAGIYRDITVGSHATLYLEEGKYHFRKMSERISFSFTIIIYSND